MESPYRKTTEDQQSLKKGVSDFRAFIDGIKIIGSKVFYYCSFIVLTFLFGFIYHLITLSIDLPRKLWHSAVSIGHKANGIENERQFKWFSLSFFGYLVKQSNDLNGFYNLVFSTLFLSFLGVSFCLILVFYHINMIPLSLMGIIAFESMLLSAIMSVVSMLIPVMFTSFGEKLFDSYYKKLKKA